MTGGWGNAKALCADDVPPVARERLWAKIDRQGPVFSNQGRCWIWVGLSGSAKRSQAMVQIGPGQIRLANRLVYVLTRGPLAAGTVLVKQCPTSRCVRHWKAPGSFSEARTSHMHLTDRYADVVALRHMYVAGASITAVVDAFGHMKRSVVISALLGETYPSEDYRRPVRSKKANYPAQVRFNAAEVAEIRAEHAAGTPVRQIARCRHAPYVTTWNAINGKRKAK